MSEVRHFAASASIMLIVIAFVIAIVAGSELAWYSVGSWFADPETDKGRTGFYIYGRFPLFIPTFMEAVIVLAVAKSLRKNLLINAAMVAFLLLKLGLYLGLYGWFHAWIDGRTDPSPTNWIAYGVMWLLSIRAIQLMDSVDATGAKSQVDSKEIVAALEFPLIYLWTIPFVGAMVWADLALFQGRPFEL